MAFLHLMDLAFDSQQFLHVMPQFMRQNVRLRKLAGGSEPAIELIEKTKVDVHLFILRTIEGPRRGSRSTTSRLRRVAEQHEFGVSIRPPCLLCQKPRLRFLRVIERKRHEFDEGRLGRIASEIRRRDGSGTRVACAAAKKSEEICFEEETENQKNKRAADAEVHAAELEAPTSPALIAAVLDVLALAIRRPSHGCSPCGRMQLAIREGSVHP